MINTRHVVHAFTTVLPVKQNKNKMSDNNKARLTTNKPSEIMVVLISSCSIRHRIIPRMLM